jgi:hypothetical protein
VSHPSLGLPPRSLDAGFPEAANRLRVARPRIAARALEAAVAADPTMRARTDDGGMRNLLRDAEVFVDRLALCVAGDDSHWLSEFAEQTATVFRRRKVALDDVVGMLEGLRSAARGVLSEDEMAPATRALDAAVAVIRLHKRLSGDAGKRGRIASALYKGPS